MTLYSLILFIHVVAVMGLSAALSFELLSLFHLRRAASVLEVRRWIDPVPAMPLMAMGSFVVILLSGIYLAVRMSAFALAWPKVTVAALLLIAPLGALTGKRLRAIRTASNTAMTIDTESLKRLRDPFLKISLGIRIAIFLGIVLLMAAKPDLWTSISIVGASILLGILASRVAWPSTGSWSPGTEPGD